MYNYVNIIYTIHCLLFALSSRQGLGIIPYAIVGSAVLKYKIA